tara:strand:+ start:260 stop:736 length:477 start_codon:yes stop_codon:yes gene_type:complete
MIRAIGQNDVWEAILLMKQSTEEHDYPTLPTEYTESVWLGYLCSLVERQHKKDPNVLVLGYYDNNLKGFLTAETFVCFYNNKAVMDVKDCIVKKNYKYNGKVVHELFTHMINHTKKHGGKHWRADSIQTYDDALRYGKFLEKRFNGNLYVSVRGKIGD